MKIIGKAGEGGFIFQASEDEAYRLIGHSSHYAANRRLEIGDSIKISEMYDRLRIMKTNEADLEKSAALLRASAELLEKALPAVHRANKGEKQKEEES